MSGKIVGTLFYRLGGVILLVSIALNFSNVVARYLFSYPIYWADEIVTFLMIWMVMLGAASAAMQNSHLSIDLILNMMKKYTIGFQIFASFVGLITCGFVIYSASDITYMKFSFGQRENASKIPGWIPHISILVGFFGCAYFILLHLLRSIFYAFAGGAGNAE